MLKILIYLLLLLPATLLAQVSVTGKVTDLTTHAPIENASVILSNSTVGNKTTADGTFTLKSVKPGQYDLVVSIVGYETYHLTITVINANLTIPPVELLPKSITLNEVVVKPDPDWARNFDIFKNELLGESAEARQCKILNPDVVQISYDARQRKLTGTSYDFMEIENLALGYKIKYLLTNFVKDYAGNTLYYEGSILFEEIKTKSAGQQKKWVKAREKAYYGSLQHYLRSALHDRSDDEGFKTLQMIRKLNPQRLPDSLIKAKLSFYRKLNTRASGDSVNKWIKEERQPKTVSYLVQNPPVNPFQLIKRTDQDGIYALSYTDFLYVMYTRVHDNTSSNISYHPLTQPDYMTTIVHFADKYAFFDNNGAVTNPTSMIFEGAWGVSRVAGMLPVDYEPAAK